MRQRRRGPARNTRARGCTGTATAGAPARSTTPASEIRFGAPEAPQVLQRQVDAASGQIVPHVANDVGQLQGQPEVDGVLPRLGAATPENLDAHQPDRRRHALAVFDQLVEGLVAQPVQVHLHPVDERVERLPRQREQAHDSLQVPSLFGCRRSAVEEPGHLLTPLRHPRPRPAPRTGSSSTASSTARQKSQTTPTARRCSAGSTRNE